MKRDINYNLYQSNYLNKGEGGGNGRKNKKMEFDKKEEVAVGGRGSTN